MSTDELKDELRENTIIIGNGVILPVCPYRSHISFLQCLVLRVISLRRKSVHLLITTPNLASFLSPFL